MCEKIQIVSLNRELYPLYYQMVQNTPWGDPMLLSSYETSLWGAIVLDRNNIIGGWVGTIKGNSPVVGLLTKCVYFDSYPIFVSNDVKEQCQELLVRFTQEYAKRDGVIMLHLTHWIRDNDLSLDYIEPNATFAISLHLTEEELWKLVESKQRNCVRKGEKSGVECIVCKGNDSVQYLSDFQRLRQQTQRHAKTKHSQASMLLKSDAFFQKLFMSANTTLFVGKVDNQVATVALMIHSGRTVYYYSGGSDYELNKQYSCSAFIIWKAICYFNEQGLDIFDMGGVPVKPAKDHPAYGVYAFKRSFGGEYQEFMAGDIIISSFKYKILKFILSQRKILRFLSTKI